MVSSQLHYTKVNRFMPFLLAEILNFQGSIHRIGVGSFSSLKEELRLPVILYYIEDFSVKEIAQILEISEGAVQKRLARARGKLRQELQEVSI